MKHLVEHPFLIVSAVASIGFHQRSIGSSIALHVKAERGVVCRMKHESVTCRYRFPCLRGGSIAGIELDQGAAGRA